MSKKVFKVWQSQKNQKWYWHLINEFGVIYAHGGNLDAERTAVAACKAVQENAPLATIEVVKER